MASAGAKRPPNQTADIEKHMDKKIRVKFQGGREVVGVLKGCDQLINLVLDDAVEYLRDPADPLRVTDQTRNLGLVVCRGTQVTVVCPEDELQEIPNPFVAAGEAGEG